jgi:hypothetical protein
MELYGGLAKIEINDTPFRCSSGSIQAATTLATTSTTEHGVFEGVTPTRRPFRCTIRQLTFDDSEDPYADPISLRPMQRVRLKIWPAGKEGENINWLFDVPDAVVGPTTHGIENTGDALQPFDVELRANGGWAAPGETLS